MAKKSEFIAALEAFLKPSDGGWDPEDSPSAEPEKETTPSSAGSSKKMPAPPAAPPSSGYDRDVLLDMIKKGDRDLQEYMAKHQKDIARDLSECLQD